MKILSHRGYWRTPNEKNSREAFERSFSLGFGTETDIRDLDGELVISHDMPVKDLGIITVREFLSLYKVYPNELPLALNIKSDGLQEALVRILDEFHITNYFIFDMSIPDTIGYLNKNMKVFTRQSEFEPIPSFYEKSEGVWLDEFESHWISYPTLENHFRNIKKVCIVSPDLHKRPYHQEWCDYKKWDKMLENSEIMLCTDFPEEAKQFFNEN